MNDACEQPQFQVCRLQGTRVDSKQLDHCTEEECQTPVCSHECQKCLRMSRQVLDGGRHCSEDGNRNLYDRSGQLQVHHESIRDCTKCIREEGVCEDIILSS